MAMDVLTAQQTRELESYVFNEQKLPSLLVMENAGRAVSDCICRDFPNGGSCLLLCGRGNNGGDGFVIARQLALRGWRVEVLLLGKQGGRSSDSQCMLDALAGSDIATIQVENDEIWRQQRPLLEGADVLVDAVFGIGLNRELSMDYQRIFCDVNEHCSGKKYAVDIPSGVDADDGHLWGESLRADCTVTFFAPKPGQLLYPGRGYVGKLEVIKLHLGEEWQRRNEAANGRQRWLQPDDLPAYLPPRRKDAHKGDFGFALLVGGSAGMVGAVHHAARAALRSGIGRLAVAVPEEVAPPLWASLPEAMTQPVPSEDGHFSGNSLDTLEEMLLGKTCVAFGPGLGRREENGEILRRLMASGLPLVVDADGLYALSEDLSLLHGAKGEILLTPHPGEMARLCGVDTAEIVARPRHWARKLALETGAVVLLKGGSSVIAGSDGALAYNTSGGPALAKGGSGDVLCGIALACLGQGLSAFDAGCCAALLLGMSADALAMDEKSVLTSDVIEAIPRAMEMSRAL